MLMLGQRCHSVGKKTPSARIRRANVFIWLAKALSARLRRANVVIMLAKSQSARLRQANVVIRSAKSQSARLYVRDNGLMLTIQGRLINYCSISNSCVSERQWSRQPDSSCLKGDGIICENGASNPHERQRTICSRTTRFRRR